MTILVKFDHIPVVRDVTDEEVEEHSREFVKHMNQTVKQRSNILKREVKKSREKKALSKIAEDWLIHMARNPYMTLVERIRALGTTNYIANKVTKELEIKGYAKKVNVYTGRPGHPLVLMDFTQKGIEHANSKGVKIKKAGKGGLVHQWWALKIKEFWKAKSMEVIVEPNVEGANTDELVIDKRGKRTAVEIALSRKNQLENVRRDLEYFDEVIVSAETKTLMMRVRAEARKALSKKDMKNVHFCLLGGFLT